MKKINVIVHGAAGRMGREIAMVLAEQDQAQMYSGVDASGLAEAKDMKEVRATRDLVVIDFSTPKGFQLALSWCLKNKTPFVSGTTGLSPKDMKSLKAASAKIPVLWAPNMSIGVQVMLKMLRHLGRGLRGFDLQVEEFHHGRKKDAPSGTAKWIQGELQASAGKKLPPVLSGRGGGIFGIHTVWMMAEEETLTLTHTALNRRVFARGAVEAAVWLAGRKPGLYALSDVIEGN